MRDLLNQRVFSAMLLVLLFPAISEAQEEHQHHEPGEKIGKVSFVVSCSTPAQKQFNRAVAWLHSFEYGESERAFNDIATIDPRCAMAHWGGAMSLYHQLWAPPSPGELEKGARAAQNVSETILPRSPSSLTIGRESIIRPAPLAMSTPWSRFTCVIRAIARPVCFTHLR